MDPTRDPKLNPKFNAALDLLRRTGMSEFQIRYSDDEKPVVWLAVGRWGRNGKDAHEVACALNPVRAVLRLCEQIVDGGSCTHCNRLTGFEADQVGPLLLDKTFCWYQWDPELKTFRRGCE